MTKNPCHLSTTYDPTCVGCEAVNDEKEKKCDCSTKYCPHYESDFDRFVKENPYVQDTSSTCKTIPVSQEESKIEHCDEPKCPACNTAAYERGRKDEHERVVKEALAYMQRCLLWSKGTVEGTRNDLIAKTANHFGITLSEAEEGK